MENTTVLIRKGQLLAAASEKKNSYKRSLLTRFKAKCSYRNHYFLFFYCGSLNVLLWTPSTKFSAMKTQFVM